jgi:hypothetical protein
MPGGAASSLRTAPMSLLNGAGKFIDLGFYKKYTSPDGLSENCSFDFLPAEVLPKIIDLNPVQNRLLIPR